MATLFRKQQPPKLLLSRLQTIVDNGKGLDGRNKLQLIIFIGLDTRYDDRYGTASHSTGEHRESSIDFLM